MNELLPLVLNFFLNWTLKKIISFLLHKGWITKKQIIFLRDYIFKTLVATVLIIYPIKTLPSCLAVGPPAAQTI